MTDTQTTTDDMIKDPDRVDAPPVPADTVSHETPSGDTPPRKRPGRPKGIKNKTKNAGITAELKDIEEKLTALLTAPAMPMAALGDAWPAEHISNRAPALAAQITLVAKNNPAFRAQLQKLLQGSSTAQLAFAAIAYLVPVLIYYGLLPAPPALSAQLQIPNRDAARAQFQQEMMAAMAFNEAVASNHAATTTPPATHDTPDATSPPA